MIREKEILRNLSDQHPGEILAIGRTVLANERTFLAFFRTALGLAAAGGGMLHLLEHPVFEGIGVGFIVAAVVCLAVGAVRYWQRRGLFNRIIARHESEL